MPLVDVALLVDEPADAVLLVSPPESLVQRPILDEHSTPVLVACVPVHLTDIVLLVANLLERTSFAT